MKLEQLDGVTLNREVEELALHGIHKGCRGIIAKLGEQRSLILFYNPDDLGDYAYAVAENSDLIFLEKIQEPIKTELAQNIAAEDPTKKTDFEPTRLREYDLVRVAVEKPKYAKEGVHEGMVGTILEPGKINGGWMVYFPDETGADTILCRIQETDLELIRHSDGTTD